MQPPEDIAKIPGLPSGRAALIAAFVAALAPVPPLDVNAWAAESRFVAAESGSPYPGKWNPDLVPYLREVQECLSDAHPCRDVWVKKSAQTGFSEVGLNLFGATAHRGPSPMLIVLPTTDEVRKYNKIKLQPTIDASPALRRAILDVKSRDADSSTALFKRFRGGYCVITGANSSVGLQMISARKTIYEEVSGYPADAGGRGDPVEQTRSRNKAWRDKKPGPKNYFVSVPNLAGDCRISDGYASSDQRKLYVQCPHCAAWQVLRWAPDKQAGTIRWTSEVRPHGAHYVCLANGCVIEPFHKRGLVAGGVWIKTYPGTNENPTPAEAFAAEELEQWQARSSAGREPGFHLWQGYSVFVSWDDTVAEYLAARVSPTKLKAFTQQGLGLEWEEKTDAPPAERLFEARENFPPRRVPLGALFITAMADVQGDRLEFGVYAWAADLQQGWLIDHGVIAGDPDGRAVWDELGKIVDRTYEGPYGQVFDIDAFGVDSGYLSNKVYEFCRRRALPTPAGTRRVFALDGRPGWKLPPLGTAKSVDVDFDGRRTGSVLIWPVGTFDMKSEHYHGLRQTLAGPDADGRARPETLHFNHSCDLAYFEQLTAEAIVDEQKGGRAVKVWANPNRKRNEALDIAVGARALARHYCIGMSAADWTNLCAARGAPPDRAQADLGALWAPRPASANAVRQGRELADAALSGPRKLKPGRSVQ